MHEAMYSNFFLKINNNVQSWGNQHYISQAGIAFVALSVLIPKIISVSNLLSTDTELEHACVYSVYIN